MNTIEVNGKILNLCIGNGQFLVYLQLSIRSMNDRFGLEKLLRALFLKGLPIEALSLSSFLLLIIPRSKPIYPTSLGITRAYGYRYSVSTTNRSQCFSLWSSTQVVDTTATF